MPHWDPDRWVHNEDGTYTRRTEAADVAGDYASMTKADLVEELESRGLSKAGNKSELIARLEDDDLE